MNSHTQIMSNMMRFGTGLGLAVGLTFSGQAYSSANGDSREPTSLLACWDGTFAYRTLRVEETATRFHVTISGVSFRLPDEGFYLNSSSESVDLATAGYNESWHISFRKTECEWADKKLTCNSGDLMNENFTQAIYRTIVTDDLGRPRTVHNKFPIQRAELVASETGLVLTKLQRFPGTGEIFSQRLVIEPHEFADGTGLICSENAVPFAKSIPARLLRHVGR